MPGGQKEIILSLYDTRWLKPIEPLFSGGNSNDIEEIEEFDPFKGYAESNVHTCTSCQFILDPDDRKQVIAHYQSPWHKYNVKQTQKGRSFITEEEFEEHDVGESTSETEESDDEEDAFLSLNSSSRSYFVQDNMVFSIYRVLLNENDTMVFPELFLKPLDCAIFLLAGGHFAAAIFKNDRVLKHKTIHRYVVRAKQGGAQSANDNASGPAHSAGANLRRYNEKTLQQEIVQLLKLWAPDLLETPLIFIRSASFNKKVFHGEGLIDKEDSRIRSIPFETRRPNLEEVQRTWKRLTSVFQHGLRENFFDDVRKLNEKNKKKTGLQKKKKDDSSYEIMSEKRKKEKIEATEKKTDHIKVVEPPKKEEDKWPLLSNQFRQELYEAIRNNSAEEIEALIENSGNSKGDILSYLNERTFSSDELTFLHVVVSFNLENSLKFLLDFGCDPSKKNMEGKVPYASSSKNMKKVFMDFRKTNSSRWEWTRTLIPEPIELNEEQLAEQEAKKKAKKLKQKEKLKEKKDTLKKEAEEKAARDAYLALSEREKRALAAEARLSRLDSAPRCVNCGNALPKVPFQYMDVNLCSTTCVAVHRANHSK